MNDIALINQIATRAADLYVRLNIVAERNAHFVKTATASEVLTVHRDIIPLRLADLLAADDGNFAHDVGGIHRHLAERGATPRLTAGFCPRYAAV